MNGSLWCSSAIAITLSTLLTGCGAFESDDIAYNLVRETREDTTGSYLRLWHYSEGMLDPPGYFLEVVESNTPVRPYAGESIIWLDGTDASPILKYESGCYAIAITSVNYAVRFEQKHWLLAFLFGSGIALNAGDTWNQTIKQKSIYFRFEK